MGITDISGRAIPRDSQTNYTGQQVLAQQPTYQTPDTESVEFFYSAFGVIAAGGTTFTLLTDAVAGGTFLQTVDQNYRAKISNIFVYCPDMVVDVAPYLFARLLVNDQPVNAWGTIPIAPRNGIAAVSFDTQLMLPPRSKLQLSVLNQDAANTHFVMMYVYGWAWVK